MPQLHGRPAIWTRPPGAPQADAAAALLDTGAWTGEVAGLVTRATVERWAKWEEVAEEAEMEVKGVGGGCGVVGKVTLELEIEGKLRGGEKRVRCVMREVKLWVVEEPVTGAELLLDWGVVATRMEATLRQDGAVVKGRIGGEEVEVEVEYTTLPEEGVGCVVADRAARIVEEDRERRGEQTEEVRRREEERVEEVWEVLMKKTREALARAVGEVEADELGGQLRGATPKGLFLDPTVVGRRVEATPWPYTADVQLRSLARPSRAGLQRRYDADKLAEAQRHVDAMVEAAVVEAAPTTADWVHPVVMAPKADGGWRFCVDFRALNVDTIEEHWRMPDVDELCRTVAAQGKWFAKLDLKAAFWQLELAEDCRHLTTFFVPGRGFFRFRAMPFGLRNAPAIFQRSMEAILAPLLGRGVVVYQDDVVVFEQSPQALVQRVSDVFALLWTHDARLSATKCLLAAPSFEMLGRVVSANSVAANVEQVMALAEYPRPTTAAELRAFLGLAGWVRRMVRNFATMAAPLFGLLTRTATGKRNDKSRLTWEKEEEEAFNKVRAAVATGPVVAAPPVDQLDNRLVVATDASGAGSSSPGGVGGALFWWDGADWRIVLAHSRALRKAEKRYDVTEIECLAAVEVVRRSEEWVRRAKGVRLLVDHRALSFIHTLAAAERGRLARWAFYLMSAEVAVVHQAGAIHHAPDALSRVGGPDEPWFSSARPFAAFGMGDPVEVDAALVAAVEVGTVRRRADIGPTLAQWEEEERHFDIIVADPPWCYAENHSNSFRRMTQTKLAALPVAKIAAPDSLLFMWTTAPKLPEATRLMAKWGFSYATAWSVWIKDRAHRGRYTRGRTEWVLMGRRGNGAGWLKEDVETRPDQVIMGGGQKKHSDKPDEFLQGLDLALRPGARRVELFCRGRARDGWSAVGDEADEEEEEGREEACGGIVAPVTTRRMREKQEARERTDQKTEVNEDDTRKEKEKEKEEEVRKRKEGGRQRQAREEEREDDSEKLDVENVLPADLPDDDGVADERLLSPPTNLLLLMAENPGSLARLAACMTSEDSAALAGVLRLDAEARRRWERERRKAENQPGWTLRWWTLEGEEVRSRVWRKNERGEWTDESGAAGVVPYLQHPDGCVWLGGKDDGHPARDALLRRLHRLSLHVGARKTAHLARQAGWWLDGAEEVVRKATSCCRWCQRRKETPPTSWVPPTSRAGGMVAGVGDVVHMDFVGPFKTAEGRSLSILSLTDEATRWPEAHVVEAQTAEAAVNGLEEWVRRFGAPRAVATDRGTAFLSGLFERTAKAMGCARLRTTAYHPHANGIEEAAHRLLAQSISAALSTRLKPASSWPEALGLALWTARNTVHASLGCTPARAVLGFDLRWPDNLSGLHNSVGGEESNDVATCARRRLEAMDAALEARRRVREEEEARAARVEPRVRPGDYVRIWSGEAVARDRLVLNAKFAAERWSEPWRVAEVVRGVSALLTKADNPMRTTTVSHLRLKVVDVQPELRARWERAYLDTMAAKKQELDKRRVVREEMRWEEVGDEHGMEDRVGVEEVLAHRGVGKEREALVEWEDGDKTWVQVTQFAADAPQAWAAYLEREGLVEAKGRKRKVGPVG